MKDRINLLIASLAVSAIVLTFGHLLLNTPAQAGESSNSRRYSIATARAIEGGDAVFVFDNDSDLVALFNWDEASKAYVVRDVRPMNAFMGGR